MISGLYNLNPFGIWKLNFHCLSLESNRVKVTSKRISETETQDSDSG